MGHFNCPICRKPDMSNKDDIQEVYELFLSMVSTGLKTVCVHQYDIICACVHHRLAAVLVPRNMHCHCTMLCTFIMITCTITVNGTTIV